jgi:murein DD-endopeptidase MepM/ murein hydrolase activator NlpD
MQFNLKRILFVLLAILAMGICFSQQAEAQRRKKKKKAKSSVTQDFTRIKAPSIRQKKQKGKKTKYKPKVEKETESLPSTSKVYPRVGQQFVPAKTPALVEEVYDSLSDAETNIVEVEEEVKLDCTWVKVTEYYGLWDSRRVNPYGVDRKSFSDTINVVLYDTTLGSFWSAPVKETFPTSHFGPRGGRFHYGTDLELDMGDTIRSVWDGIVRITSFDARGYGYYVLVRHYNGLETLYGHLSSIQTEVGTLVKAGQPIGLGGNTGRSSGPHLHFEIRYQGNPINAEEVFHFSSGSILKDQFLLTPEQFGYAARKARKVYYHRVRPGDTMYSIASRYGITISRLARLNGISARSKLRSGRRLRVKV